MTEPVIRVEGLGKRYRIGVLEQEPSSLRRRMRELVTSPFRYLREMSRPPTEQETLWAIRNISFEVEPGQVVGIIGRNGAGKSTLLKILSRITDPTEGRAIIDGRIGSLLEVGTGFHPDMTGRENIYLNGAILGMKKREIDGKLDEIVEFSEISKFIDTPVKRYSSGMYVRLAFSVAAHLEPEILILDEVLAVGDAPFRKKCLDRMSLVAKQGRTILFVSHNIGAISALTTWSILLDQGQVKFMGPTEEAIHEYMAAAYQNAIEWHTTEVTPNPIQVWRVELSSAAGVRSAEFSQGEELVVTLEYEVRELVQETNIAVIVHAADGALLFSTEDIDTHPELLEQRAPGRYVSRVRIPGDWLNRGDYYVRIGSGITGVKSFDNIEALRFRLIDTTHHFVRAHRYASYFLPQLPWQTERIGSPADIHWPAGELQLAWPASPTPA